MLKAFLILLAGLSAAPASLAAPAAGVGTCAGKPEQACLFETIWTAAGALPATKQQRLAPLFLDTVRLSPDSALVQTWQARLPGVKPAAPRAANYAEDQARAVIAETGWASFTARARAGGAPFNLGRPEIMAAGVRLAPDAATARRLIDAMFDLAVSGASHSRLEGDFETQDFGHALAELSMQRCDLVAFDRAVALTAAPDGLRYALWRARITGGASALASRIAYNADADDTRHVRQALEGYRPILALGYCNR
ncbi:hypothetical protein [Hyphomonas johnsonii]|uniref:Putative lipoprotein n=1 Tax=Hyphomonas johnsonii MHS-2 TaxID=1280950 RepID=A0A059FJQ0_9PROT|nr:hypothetical protein [Hyphomonas johnsonii]KCZ90761.1 putative lipoprotein [Hyphomonas johnsonii MHS-2]